MTNALLSMTSVVTMAADCAGDATAIKIRSRGPEYFRERILDRDSRFPRPVGSRKSAVELLEETKPLYVKTERVLDSQQVPLHPDKLHISNKGRSQEGELSKPAVANGDHASSPNATGVFSWSQPRGVVGRGGEGGAPAPRPIPRAAPPGKRGNRYRYPRPGAVTTMCEDEVEGVQSDLSELSLKRVKYNGMELDCAAQTATNNSDPKKLQIPTISTEEWRDSRTDTSSELDHPDQASHSKADDNSISAVRRRHRRPICRSGSDLTKRFSNSSDISDLSARFSRHSTDLEKFFNEMGLEKGVLDPLLGPRFAHAQSSSSLNVFENVSSLASDARSWGSGDSRKSDQRVSTSMGIGEKLSGQTSIVERNARIIKWLCNVKKATTPPEGE